MKTQKTKLIIFTVIITAALACGIFIVKSNNNSKFQQQLKLGNDALLNMDYEAAVTAFANAIGLNPKDVQAYLGIAKAYVALDDYGSASEYLSKGRVEIPEPSILTMLDSLTADAFTSLGKEFMAQGDLDSAKDAFNEALKQNPENEEAQKGLEDIEASPKPAPDADTDADTEGDIPNNEANTPNVDDSAANGNSLPFKPSDITFFGYPVTENHYEEWKASLNFSGNDTDPTYGGDPNSGFCDLLICGNGTYSDFGSSLKVDLLDSGYNVFLGWNKSSNISVPMYTFMMNASNTHGHIFDQYVSSPIYIGQSFDEALQMIGYTGEITYGSPYDTTSAIALSDDLTIRFFSFDGKNAVELLFYQNTFVQFYGSNNVISQIVVQAPAL